MRIAPGCVDSTRAVVSRRAFLAAVAAVGFAPILGGAQRSDRMRRIGFLSPATAFRPESEELVWRPLGKLGWHEGANLVIERRYAAGRTELLQPMAEELVKLRVEAIVAHGTPAALAAKRATGTIPIVIHRSGDPVALGLVSGLSRPGGNITGTSTISPQLDAKRLELVREVLPHAKRIGEMTYSPNPLYRATSKQKEDLYRSFKLTPIFVDATEAGALETAVEEVARRGGQALIIGAEALFIQSLDSIVAAARRSSMPLIGPSPSWLGTGVLMGYGPSEDEYLENMAALVDQILKGAKPGDLPIRQPAKFEMGIDLNAAKALGITVPKSVLMRADVVIR